MGSYGDGLEVFDLGLDDALLVAIPFIVTIAFSAEEDLDAGQPIRETPQRSLDERFDLRLPAAIRKPVVSRFNLNVHDCPQPFYFETGHGGFGVYFHRLRSL